MTYNQLLTFTTMPKKLDGLSKIIQREIGKMSFEQLLLLQSVVKDKIADNKKEAIADLEKKLNELKNL